VTVITPTMIEQQGTCFDIACPARSPGRAHPVRAALRTGQPSRMDQRAHQGPAGAAERARGANMKRRHAMPFGAELGRGSTRFRLWAPAADRVDLELWRDQSRISVLMRTLGAGWHEASIAHAPAGTRYAFRIDERDHRAGPASRFNPEDCHAASAVVDPLAFDWPDEVWLGRPWHEAVIYELHLGTFTPEGTCGAGDGSSRLPGRSRCKPQSS